MAEASGHSLSREQRKENGTEEMAVLVTCLPHKRKDLSLITRTHKNHGDGEMWEEM